jgi:hypothetical protein
MNAPAWLRCEHCLWWKTAADPGEGWGCTYAGIPRPMSAFDRCHHWTCKRCFSPWNVPVHYGNEVVNHFHCKRLGRGKPKAELADMEAKPFSDPEFRKQYNALLKKLRRIEAKE